MTRTAGIVCILLLGACAAALWLLPLPDQRLALDWLKGHEMALQALVLAHPAASLAAFTLLYIITAGLYLPGVAALTLAAGALFGLWPGALAAWLGRNLGALLGAWISRRFLQRFVRTRSPQAVDEFRKGLEADGALYVFAMRTFPGFPFGLTNLAAGVSDIPLHWFFAASLAGSLPSTLIWVSAGQELARISSPKDVLSPVLFGCLCALAVLPLAVRWSLPLLRRLLRPASTR